MKKTIGVLSALLLLVAGCKEKPKDTPVSENESSMAEPPPEADDWIILFDGSSFEAWKGYNQSEVPDTWKLEDDAMVFVPPEDRPDGASYNLVTREDYGDFILSLEWRISEGGNSGVFWGVAERPDLGQPYQTGPEIQVLDNEKHPDARNGTTHQAGALYDMIAPSSDVTRPVGEWNTMELTINYTEEEGKVVLNGTEIVRFPLGNADWDAMVADSKFADWEAFGAYQNGKIGLQDHGDPVAYKNIKIKPLK